MDCENGRKVGFDSISTESENGFKVIDLISHFGEEPFLLSSLKCSDSEQETIYRLL